MRLCAPLSASSSALSMCVSVQLQDSHHLPAYEKQFLNCWWSSIPFTWQKLLRMLLVMQQPWLVASEANSFLKLQARSTFQLRLFRTTITTIATFNFWCNSRKHAATHIKPYHTCCTIRFCTYFRFTHLLHINLLQLWRESYLRWLNPATTINPQTRHICK